MTKTYDELKDGTPILCAINHFNVKGMSYMLFIKDTSNLTGYKFSRIIMRVRQTLETWMKRYDALEEQYKRNGVGVCSGYPTKESLIEYQVTCAAI